MSQITTATARVAAVLASTHLQDVKLPPSYPKLQVDENISDAQLQGAGLDIRGGAQAWLDHYNKTGKLAFKNLTDADGKAIKGGVVTLPANGQSIELFKENRDYTLIYKGKAEDDKSYKEITIEFGNGKAKMTEKTVKP